MKDVTKDTKVTMELSREEMSLIGYSLMFLAGSTVPEIQDERDHQKAMASAQSQLPRTTYELIGSIGNLVEKLSIAIEEQVLSR